MPHRSAAPCCCCWHSDPPRRASPRGAPPASIPCRRCVTSDRVRDHRMLTESAGNRGCLERVQVELRRGPAELQTLLVVWPRTKSFHFYRQLRAALPGHRQARPCDTTLRSATVTRAVDTVI